MSKQYFALKFFLHTRKIYVNRFRKILKDIERKHSVKERWKPGHPNFDVVALQVIQGKRKDTIGALHGLSIERHFLITLKKKYAGTVMHCKFRILVT